MAGQRDREALPTAISTSAFTVGGTTYEVLRYAIGKGPTLAQTISIANGRPGSEMLTLAEARKIRDTADLDAAFRGAGALEYGDWAYVRDAVSEKRGGAAWLGRVRSVDRLSASSNIGAGVAARVVVLKKTSGASVQSPANSAAALREAVDAHNATQAARAKQAADLRKQADQIDADAAAKSKALRMQADQIEKDAAADTVKAKQAVELLRNQ